MKTLIQNWPVMLGAMLPWASIVIAAVLSPRLSRRDLFFAVTVQPAFREGTEAREILRGYDRAAVIMAVASLVPLLMLAVRPELAMLWVFGPPVLALTGWFAAFTVAYRRAAAHRAVPSTVREAAVLPRNAPPTGGWAWQIVPFAILGAAAIILGMYWDEIPGQIPVHFDIHGTPNRWVTKSAGSVFGMLIIAGLLCALLAGLNISLAYSMRRIHATGPEANREAGFVRLISRLLLGLECLVAVIFGGFGLLALRSNPNAPLRELFPLMLVPAVGTIAILFYVFRRWQRGSAAEPRATAAEPAMPIGDRTPDRCWKWGLIYYNAEDPALWVEKRFGFGWTLNFANPRSYVVLGSILIFVSASLVIGLVANL